MTTSAKILTWSTILVVLALAGYIFIKFFFVYAEGINEGDINYFQKEGYISRLMRAR